VAFGGTLYQDIEAQHEGGLRHRDPVTYDQNFHEIELVQGTRLSKLYPQVEKARVNSIHHQGIKGLAPGFEIEAWSLPDRVPEAIRRRPDKGRSYIAATQWHPEFHKYGSTETVDDTPILHDFLWACATAKVAPKTLPRSSSGKIRDRAARVLRQALLRR
jgi:putative glutamine amidotransferase